MGNDQQINPSPGISTLESRLKKLWIAFTIMQVLSLLLIVLSIEFSNYRNRKTVATSLTEALSNALLIKDYRRVAEVLTTSSKNDFTRIAVIDFSNGHELTVDHGQSSFGEIQIDIPIFFDSSNKIKIGEAKFTYHFFSMYFDVVFVWLCLLFISFLILYRYRQSTIVDYKKDLEFKSAKKMEEVARRLAHDIRSPLSALNILVTTAQEISIEQREIIQQVSQRINGIADSLLNEFKAPNVNTDETRDTYILPVIEKIVSEKRIEFKNQPGIELILRPNSITKLNKTSIPELELQRLASNLINNSVEALSENGQIYLDLHKKNDMIVLSIIDFGKGIPPEILQRLQQYDFISYGKERSKKSGSGIGLKSAYLTLKKYGATMRIDSKVGIGTQIQIEIPISK